MSDKTITLTVDELSDYLISNNLVASVKFECASTPCKHNIERPCVYAVFLIRDTPADSFKTPELPKVCCMDNETQITFKEIKENNSNGKTELNIYT